MAEYLVTDTDLTSVADTIRSKKGTSAKLSFPDGWKDAINTISSDGTYIPSEPYIEEVYGGSDGGYLISATLRGYTFVRAYAFYEQQSLSSVTLPDGITEIKDYAFGDCRLLNLSSLPSSLTTIRRQAFYSCFELAITSLPSGLRTIEDYSFSGCHKLAISSFPDSLSSIDNHAFDGCENLTSIIFNGATILEPFAFNNCTGLTSVIFKKTPSKIGSGAFQGCTNLTEIKVPWAEGEVANAPWGATNATITYNYTESA